MKNEELLSPIINSPVFAILKRATPDALAANISPLFVWLIIAAALPPIPPDTESGAGVLVLLPIYIPVSESDERTRSPVPDGVITILLFDPFEIVLEFSDKLLVPKSRVPILVMF